MPADTIRWFGAMQAQDYLGSLWALGLRTAGASEKNIESAIADGSVLRTHSFRGTWQYVARDDVRWILELMGPRVISAARPRLLALGLDGKTLARSADLLSEALSGGKQLTRREIEAVLSRARVTTADGRLPHLLAYHELRGLVCSGAPRQKQPTFALLADRAPRSASIPREQALAQLAKTYFQSRGPATAHDFAWWTGLPLREVREAIELAKDQVHSIMLEGTTYWLVGELAVGRRSSVQLLPAFDEYLIAYRDRSAVIDPVHWRKVNRGGGMLRPALIANGRIVGTWSRSLAKGRVAIAVAPFRPLLESERSALHVAARRYAAFLGAADHELLVQRVH